MALLPVLSLGTGVGSGLSILSGAAIAERLAARRGQVLGLVAGLIVGIALFDLLPTAAELDGDVPGTRLLLALTATGFAGYLVVARLGKGPLAPHLGPASLLVHAGIDGFMVGVGFDISARAGIAIAAATLAHGVVHGINTVSLATAGGGSPTLARRWVAANALAPLAGIALALAIPASPATLSMLLAAVAGVFLYIGAAELLPKATPYAPLAGFALAVILVALIGA